MNFTYIAQRSLIAGHVAGVEYAASFATTATGRTRDVEKTLQRALGGITETLYFRADQRWRITFAPVRGTELAALREMLDSTESGGTFTATVNGDAVAAVTVIRADSGYSMSEAISAGNAPLTTDSFVIDIEVQAA